MPLFGLAPGGVYHATPVTRRPVRSYRTLSPLLARARAVYFLWHFPSGHPDWPSPAPCPSEPGLSSTSRAARTTLDAAIIFAPSANSSSNRQSTASRTQRWTDLHSRIGLQLAVEEDAVHGQSLFVRQQRIVVATQAFEDFAVKRP